MPAKIDITGRRYGRLMVIGDGPKAPTGRRTVRCHCDCGNTLEADPRCLMRGHTQSCGCYHREQVRKSSASRYTHHMSRTAEYDTWKKIKGRCGNPADKKYAIYGGRGIKVCERWASSFEAFLADMGSRPDGTTIDRIDVNGDYAPENCRWATVLEQARNRRSHRIVQYGGRFMPLSEACEATGTNYRAALSRLNHGKPWQPLPPTDWAPQGFVRPEVVGE